MYSALLCAAAYERPKGAKEHLSTYIYSYPISCLTTSSTTAVQLVSSM